MTCWIRKLILWCSGSEPGLFYSNYLFEFGVKPIQDYFLHDFARLTDEADGSVVLADL